MNFDFLIELATITGAILAGVMTPGPDFIASAHAGLSGNKRSGLLVAAGIAVGSMTWALLSFAGLSLLFSTFAWSYTAIKFLGAAFLIYIGLKMIRSSAAFNQPDKNASGFGKPGRAFQLGLMTDLANPKTAVFFSSLFVLVLPPDAALWKQAIVTGLVGLIAFCWYGFISLFFGTEVISNLYQRAGRLLTIVTGGILAGLGVRLALEKS